MLNINKINPVIIFKINGKIYTETNPIPPGEVKDFYVGYYPRVHNDEFMRIDEENIKAHILGGFSLDDRPLEVGFNKTDDYGVIFVAIRNEGQDLFSSTQIISNDGEDDFISEDSEWHLSKEKSISVEGTELLVGWVRNKWSDNDTLKFDL